MVSRWVGVWLVVGALGSACTTDPKDADSVEPTDSETDPGDTELQPGAVPFATVADVFVVCSGCHQPGHSTGLDLSRDPSAATVGVPSGQLPTMNYVESGKPQQSYLWHKMADTHIDAGGSGFRMPFGGMSTPEQVEAVRLWIAAGAAAPADTDAYWESDTDLQRDSDSDTEAGDTQTDTEVVDTETDPTDTLVVPTDTEPGGTDTLVVVPTDTDTDLPGPAFGDAVQNLLQTRCAFCHSSPGHVSGLDLSTDPYGATVNTPSDDVPSMDRIEPGSTATSYLWHKVQGTHGSVGGSGSRMPLSGGFLDAQEQADLEAWILGGALP